MDQTDFWAGLGALIASIAGYFGLRKTFKRSKDSRIFHVKLSEMDSDLLKEIANGVAATSIAIERLRSEQSQMHKDIQSLWRDLLRDGK